MSTMANNSVVNDHYAVAKGHQATPVAMDTHMEKALQKGLNLFRFTLWFLSL